MGLPQNINRVKLAEILRAKYPDYKWDKVYLLRGKYAQQQRLESAIRRIFEVQHSLQDKNPLTLGFQGKSMIINAREEGGLVNPTTQEYLELDVLLPELNLAFEYQVSLIRVRKV